MLVPEHTLRRTWLAAEVLLILGTIAASVAEARATEWQPAVLAIFLLVLASAGERFTVTLPGGSVVSASLGAMVLAMGLLGPAAAAACGITAAMTFSAARRRTASQWLGNICAYSIPPFVGGWLVRVASSVLDVSRTHTSGQLVFGLTVLLALIVLLALNFILWAFDLRVCEGESIARLARDFRMPTLSGELAVGVLASTLAVLYRGAGLPVLVAVVPVLLIFRQLTVALLRSEERADQLEARTINLTSLQDAVLRAFVGALRTRDPATGRHSAGVALYARELAEEIGAEPSDQDTVRVAALLHDIAKVTWPDRVLHAEAHGETLAAEDQALIDNAPQLCAELIGQLDGYGAVADTVLYHRERIDGSGYPAGLIGKEIPLTSRILAVCCVYDAMHSRGDYRPSMTEPEAMNELRVAAERGQLDPELVDAFLSLLQRKGPELEQHVLTADDLDIRRHTATTTTAADPRAARASGLSPHY
jgi:putative nucleotidyltransferase with HDIG domain